MNKDELLYRSSTIFTPSAPVSTRDLFSGRIDQIRATLNTINQIGQHAVIYGERGVGKTSLANVIQAFLPSNNGDRIITVKVNCDAGTKFQALFESLLSDITLHASRQKIGFNAQDEAKTYTLNEMMAERHLGDPNHLRQLFRQLSAKVIIILDEFDRMTDMDTKRLLADTIKNFSDYGVDVTFIVVGVADSVDTLIAEHESIERAMVQIKMPRMVEQETSDIVTKGMAKLGMSISTSAQERIVNLSQGLPHYTHLLSLSAAQNAMIRESTDVAAEDVKAAIDEAIEKSQQSIRDAYYRAVSSPRGNIFPQVLLACAMANKDELGYFAPSDLKAPLKKILRKNYEVSAYVRHLAAFCSKERGPVLQKIGYPRRFRYRFINPLIEPFALMHGLSKEYIREDDL